MIYVPFNQSITKFFRNCCAYTTCAGGTRGVVSLGKTPFSSQWCTAWEIKWNGSSVVEFLFGAASASGVAGLQGSALPPMMARRGYEILKPPYLLTFSTSGGVVMLKAKRQKTVKYSRSSVRESRGLISGGVFPVYLSLIMTMHRAP